jgi:hypothetical protein
MPRVGLENTCSELSQQALILVRRLGQGPALVARRIRTLNGGQCQLCRAK